MSEMVFGGGSHDRFAAQHLAGFPVRHTAGGDYRQIEPLPHQHPPQICAGFAGDLHLYAGEGAREARQDFGLYI